MLWYQHSMLLFHGDMLIDDYFQTNVLHILPIMHLVEVNCPPFPSKAGQLRRGVLKWVDVEWVESELMHKCIICVNQLLRRLKWSEEDCSELLLSVKRISSQRDSGCIPIVTLSRDPLSSSSDLHWYNLSLNKAWERRSLGGDHTEGSGGCRAGGVALPFCWSPDESRR